MIQVKKTLCLFFAAVAMLLTFTLARAQSSAGGVNGTLTDPSGGRVPGAKVALHGVSTGTDRVAVSNGDGRYVFTDVLPGNYSLSAEAPGFKRVQQPVFTVEVNQTVVLDYRLSIGDLQEQVTVEGSAPLLQTATSELGTVIGTKAVNDLPLNGRNFTQLLTLTPGVTPVQNEQGAGGGTSYLADVTIPGSPVFRPNVNGQWNRSNLYFLDGIFNTVNIYSGYAVLPIIDAVQEFKVQSHNDDAQYGGAMGGIINLVSKSGTAHIHGSAWEYLRNNFFDARDPFADATTPGPTAFHQNEFGATIGGPVFVPKLYDGRAKTFFFFAYEGWRYKRATQSLYYVPTTAEISGDFSHSILAQNIFDPASTQASSTAPSGYIRQQFSDGGVLNKIPQSRLNPLAVAYFQNYSDTPNYFNPALPQYNVVNTDPQVDTSNTYQIKIDEQLGKKDTISGRFTKFHNTDLTPVTLKLNTNTNRPRTNTGGDWAHQFTSAFISDVKFGYSYNPIIQNTVFSNGTGAASQAGFSGLASYGVPALTLQSPWASHGEQLVNQQDRVYQTAEGISWLKGDHFITAGFQWLLQQYQTVNYADQTYSFINDTTGDPNNPGSTGASLASALLGVPTQQNYLNQNWSESFPVWALYLQDQWKVSHNVTLNMGLRYDKLQPIGNLSGALFGGFDANTGQYLISGKQLPPACSTAQKAPCIPGNGDLASIPYGDHIGLSPCSSYRCPQYFNIGPHLGFAWQFAPDTVIRGGYGIAYDEYAGFLQDMADHVGNWPDAQSVFQAENQTTGQPLTYIQNLQNLSAAPLPSATPWGTTYWNADPKKMVPMSQQWNLEIEKQAMKGLVVSAAYVGSDTHHLDYTGVANTAVTPGAGTAAQVNAKRPYPYENSLFFGRSIGTANYNSLQLSAKQRMTHGFQYLISYTWSKSIDNGTSGFLASENGPGGGVQDYYHPNSNRAVSGFDVPHFLSSSVLWVLPFGKGQRFLRSGPASWVLGDWQANSIFSIRSGQPFGILANGDVANIGTPYSYARANQTGNPDLPHSTNREWFNTAAFSVPSFTYGDAPRNGLRSDHATTFDLSAFKRFPILSEGTYLEFRAEAFNIFNIINYAAPGDTVNAPGFGVVSSIVNPPRQLQFALKLNY